MGPVKRLYPVAFSGGIDTKTDPKQVIPGKLLDLQNGIFGQTGMVNRRWGYTALGTGIIGSALPIAKCAAVEGSYNNELLMYDGQNAYSYIVANNAWANRGEFVSVIQTAVRNPRRIMFMHVLGLGLASAVWASSAVHAPPASATGHCYELLYFLG